MPVGDFHIVDGGLLGAVGDLTHGHGQAVGAQQLVALDQVAGSGPGAVGPEGVLGGGLHRVGAHLQLDQGVGLPLHGLQHRLEGQVLIFNFLSAL